MRFTETPLPGAFIIEMEPNVDERGFFARSFCREEFSERGLNPQVAQCSVSYNARRGTLRGLHFQAAPHAEAKRVRCTAGAIYDVIVDVRPASPAYRRWFSVELSARNRTMLYVPEGVAHGFQALEDHTEVEYQISVSYQPSHQRGVRWNDPALGIPWPVAEPTLSTRDRALPLLRELTA